MSAPSVEPVRLTVEERMAKRLLRVAAEAPYSAKGQMFDLVDGWSVATQGHFLIAVHGTLPLMKAERAYPPMLDFARQFLALPVTGDGQDIRALRKWAVVPHCRSCNCLPSPRQGKLCGVLLDRAYLAQILLAVKPLGDGPVVIAANPPGIVKDDPLATSGTHLVLFGEGWRALIMAVREAVAFSEFGA